MKLRGRLLGKLRRWSERVRKSRSPDQVIGGHERPYLLRWYVIPRNPVFNVYLHEFRRSDDDRALHDHPWFNASLILAGAYIEHTIRAGGVHVQTTRMDGDIAFRAPWSAHRIELYGPPGGGEFWCWTLFVTGPRMRAWGFHCPKGWVHWERFTAPHDRGAIGRGCD